MKKDRLTLQHIKCDLNREIKNSYGRLALFTLLFLIVSLPFFLLFLANSAPIIVLARIFWGLLAFLALLLPIIQAVDLVKLHRLTDRPHCVVKDTLIGMEVQDHVTRYRLYQTYHFHFSSYGEYVIPGGNYPWSKLYALSTRGVYTYAHCGDEFYLVLSKPHTGKILLVYSTRLFELETQP